MDVFQEAVGQGCRSAGGGLSMDRLPADNTNRRETPPMPLLQPDSTDPRELSVPSGRDDLPKSLGDIVGLSARDALPPEQLARFRGELPPSFFIVGAPRCGTTALSKALARNPHISFSKPKETHYLLQDRPDQSLQEQREVYLATYHPGLGDAHQAIGDGSVTYLYEPDAIRRALDFDPRARFIVQVRDPLDMLASYHSRLIYQLDEDESDFGRAWDLQGERAQGRALPKRCRDPRMLMYGHAAMLGELVERLFETAGRERCHVVFFEDLTTRTRETYLNVLEFLGVDDDGQSEFKQRRESAGFRYAWLQQYVMNPPPWTLHLLKLSKGRLLKRLKPLRRRIKNMNNRPQSRPALSAAMRLRLREHFAADVARLGALTHRDLSHWLRVD